MAGRVHTAQRTPRAARLAAACTVLWAGLACAQGHGADGAPPAAQPPHASVDITRLLPSFGAERAGPRTRTTAAASLPDPRALKGANALEAGRLRLNLKGFSLLEAREGEGTEVRVRRVREREWRRPVLSLTFQKRF